jgi:GDP-L-fucose synthase
MYPPGTGRAIAEGEIDPNAFEPTNEGYALAKKHLLDLVRFAREQHGFHWTQLVLSNLYGPGDNFDPDSSHLLAAIVDKILAAKESNSPKVEIWGSGKPRREFTFANDVSDWIADFLETDSSSWPESLNLGYGVDQSVRELYEIAAEIVGWDGKFEFDNSKPDGAMDKLMDSSKAKKSNFWQPKTDVRSGIKRTIEWRLQNS